MFRSFVLTKGSTSGYVGEKSERQKDILIEQCDVFKQYFSEIASQLEETKQRGIRYIHEVGLTFEDAGFDVAYSLSVGSSISLRFSERVESLLKSAYDINYAN